MLGFECAKRRCAPRRKQLARGCGPVCGGQLGVEVAKARAARRGPGSPHRGLADAALTDQNLDGWAGVFGFKQALKGRAARGQLDRLSSIAKQRQLGRFDTELETAKAVVWWRISGDKLKSPKKERNKPAW